MTIESWNLVFSAATTGLVLVGGIWLKYVVAQQLATKDTTIQALNAAIKLHETEIAGLKGERAPAIVQDYKAMREHAEQITKEKRELSERVNNLTEEQKESQKLKPLLGLMYEVDGLSFASDVFKEAFTVHDYGQEPNVLSEGLVSLNHIQVGFSGFTYPLREMALNLMNAEKKVQHKIESNMAIIRNGLKGVPLNTLREK
jgi:hypothetical protein